jgi:hypothetical protein
MPKSYKLIVTGLFNSGKTTFVNTLCEGTAINTDQTTHWRTEQQVKPNTTVALDYGTIRINKHSLVHLFGTPGQARFDFMWHILAKGMHGFIFLIDSTDRQSLSQAPHLLNDLKQRGNVPYVLAANKADCLGLSSVEIGRALKLVDRPLIMPCIATNKRSAQKVVEHLLTLIDLN